MRAARLGVARWRVVLAAVFVATTLPFAFVHVTLWWLTAFVAFLAGIVLANSRYRPTDEEERGELTVDGGTLRFDGRPLELEEVKRVRVIPATGHAEVDLGRGLRSPLRFRVAKTEDARDLIRALGLEATRRRDRLHLHLGFESSLLFHLVPSFTGVLISRAGGAVGATLLAAVIALSLIRRASFYLDVGPDGLFLKRPMFSTRVAPNEIVGVRRGRSARYLVEMHVYRARELPLTLWLHEDNAAALEVKLAELREGQPHDNVDADCARRLESHSLADLRSLGSTRETFRVAGFDPAVLGRLVVDQLASPRARARAAIVLGAGDQLRIATEQTTIPELREVFERVESDDVEEALAAVDRIVT